MKTIDFNALKNNDEIYKQKICNAEESFKGDWNDKVHDSFSRYIRQIKEYSRLLHTLRGKAETLEKEVVEMKIDEVIKRADSLCEEADSI